MVRFAIKNVLVSAIHRKISKKNRLENIEALIMKLGTRVKRLLKTNH